MHALTTATKGRNGSSTYGIGSDGRIACYVDENDIAWCNSNWDSNVRSASIETANLQPDSKVTDAALNSLTCARSVFNILYPHCKYQFRILQIHCFLTETGKLHYHSISSTGSGALLISIFSTLPFRIWMILSAIGVSARLWVMTMTVIFRSLHVLCSRERICFPVT